MSEDKSDKWRLPEPIFRHSEGEIVKRPLDPAPLPETDPEADTLQPGNQDESEGRSSEDPLADLYSPPGEDDDIVAPALQQPPSFDIQPQPRISEQFTTEEINIEAVEPRPKRKGWLRRFFLTFLIFLLGVTGVTILVVYFIFTRLWHSVGD
jgi:hypothetical protein